MRGLGAQSSVTRIAQEKDEREFRRGHFMPNTHSFMKAAIVSLLFITVIERDILYAADRKVPEVEGVYILTKLNNLIALRSTKNESSGVKLRGNSPDEELAKLKWRPFYYHRLTDHEHTPVINGDDIDGFYVDLKGGQFASIACLAVMRYFVDGSELLHHNGDGTADSTKHVVLSPTGYDKIAFRVNSIDRFTSFVRVDDKYDHIWQDPFETATAYTVDLTSKKMVPCVGFYVNVSNTDGTFSAYHFLTTESLRNTLKYMSEVGPPDNYKYFEDLLEKNKRR